MFGEDFRPLQLTVLELQHLEIVQGEVIHAIVTTNIHHFVRHIINYYCAKSQTNRLEFRFSMIFFVFFFTFKMAAMTTGS